jgi:xylan 1,4-beta-xylosidase
MPIVLSAAFDDDLVYQVADVISTEFRAYSNAGRDSFDAYTPNLSEWSRKDILVSACEAEG